MKLLTKAVFYTSLAFFGGTRADSQAVSYGGIGDPATAPGDPGSSYALTGLDHVNYYSGAVNITIPIHSIGGRGTAADNIVIPIQRQWLVTNVGGSYAPGSPLTLPMSGSYTSGYIRFTTVSGNAYQCTTYDGNGNVIGYSPLGPYLSYVIWTRSDGTQTVLTDDNSGGAPENAQVQNCGDSFTPYDRGTVFHSHDGSNMKYVANSDVYDGGSLHGGTLFTSDGTQYGFSQEGYVNNIKDRNGNQVTLSLSSTNSGGIYYVTDPVGRVSTINFTEVLGSNNQDVISYPGAYGTTRNITVNYSLLGGPNVLAPGQPLQSYQSLFPELSGGSNSFNPYVISSIVLADGTSYTIQYDSYGEPARLTLPTGAVIAYQYSGLGTNGDGVFQMNNGDYGIYRYPTQRQEYADGVNVTGRMDFNFQPGGGPTDSNHLSRPVSQTIVSFRNPNYNILRSELHRFYGTPTPASPPASDPTTFSAWWPGLEFHTEVDTDDPTGNSPWQPLQIVDRAWRNYGCSDSNCDSDRANHPNINTMWTSYDDVQTSTEYTYDSYNRVTDTRVHNWNRDGGGVARETTISYADVGNSSTQGNPGYVQSSNIFGLVSEVKVLDASGNQQADTQYTYDEYTNGNSFMYNCPNIIGHDNGNYAGGGLRGNVTHVSQWLSTNNSWVDTYQAYDIAGNPVIATDANGHTASHLNFSDNYSDGQNHGTYAQATSGTDAAGHSWSAQYDYASGKQIAMLGLNGVFTYMEYNDPLDRLTKTTRPDGGTSTVTYAAPTVAVYCQDLNGTGDCTLHTETIYDGLGRTTQQVTFEDGPNFIIKGTAYDGLGRVSLDYNPSRLTNGNGDGLGYATSYSYDALGRVTRVFSPDNSSSTTSYSGKTVTVTDAATHQKKYTYDALGNLINVAEDPNGLNYSTNYSYNTLGKLIGVDQGTQPRTFTFDSLGRMTQAINPESGTTNFTYDSAGNLTSKTDARQVMTNFSYDSINRLTGKSYSDGTPSVSYGYDAGGVANSQGQLTSVSSSLGTTSYTNFDVMGRVLASTSQVGQYSYPFSYSYDLAGHLKTETYPTGRSINNCYDVAGRLNCVQGTANGQTTTYTTGVDYWPHGAPYYMLYGNNVWPVYTYNNRLQMNQWYATIGADANHFLVYNNLNWGSSDNNGNLNQQSEIYGNNVPANQMSGVSWAYTYDTLNRLIYATDSGGWHRNFNYDQTGNMWVTNNNGVPLQGNTPTSNVFTANNQMNSTYDGAGNQTNVNGLSVSYDAENHPTVAWEPPSMGGGSVSYWYDGLGQRTLRALPTQEFVYAFDAFGQLAVKYAQGTTPVQEYIWFGSQLLATENSNNGAPCSTCYFVWDHLGSTRLVLDQYANVIARHDYLPFGEEIPAGYAGRDSSFGVNDSLDQKFTGQQRDGESGEDNFNARYFAGSMGRFMSPDPMNAGAVLTDPQTWNGYVYVRNNPMSRIDPSGMDDGGCSPENDPLCDPDWPPFFPPLPTPDPPPPVTVKEPVPPGSFPGGETLGLPPGTSIPGPFGIPGGECEFGACGNNFTNYGQTQTASQLQQAYDEVTAGRLIGLLNIKNHSCGECKYDYGWNSHSADTWNVCGQILNADQMGNFMAGYQAGVYDRYYFWTTGAIWAQGSVDAAGILYHLTGRTKATNDPLDRTGMPDILRGQRYARHGCSAM